MWPFKKKKRPIQKTMGAGMLSKIPPEAFARPSVPFPKLRDNIPELAPLVNAWRKSAADHQWNAPASPEEIAQAEQKLGKLFPVHFRALYQLFNGFSLCGSNTVFDELDGDEWTSVVGFNEQMRTGPETFPPELLFFGGDGGDSNFALWLPASEERLTTCPVIEVIEQSTEMLGLVGTTLAAFLKYRTAYYADCHENPRPIYDALNLPREPWVDEGSDEEWNALVGWADPTLAAMPPSLRSERADHDELREACSKLLVPAT